MTLHFDNTELEIQVDDTSYRYRQVKNFHKLVLYYSLTHHVEIPIGAWVEYEGAIYTLTKPSNFTKNSTRDFSYTLTLEYDWAASAKYKLRNPVDGRLKFSYTAKPHEFVQLVVDNMNTRESGWKVGDCVDAVEQVISFNHAYCNDALGQIADAFNTEWDVTGKTIHLRKVEYYKDNPLSLAYGRGNGFKKEISRSNQDSSRAVEILYVQGGSENINPSKYGGSELLLPKNQELTYEGRVYVSSSDGLSIRRKGKTPSTKVEDSLDCSEISPKRVGTVSSVVIVDAEKHFYDFTDSSIPAELNFTDCLIDGETMTVIFQSGMLAGKEFDVKYFHEAKTVNGVYKAARRFEIVPQEIDGQTMPNETFKPVAGKDAYAVFHISLPDSYVCNNSDESGASWDMFREAARYLYEHEGELFTFKGELDGIWAKKDWLNIGGRIKPGAYVLFSDEQFNQEGSLVRMTGVKDFVNNPHSPVIELSNAPVTSSFSSAMNKVEEAEVVVDEQYRKSFQFTKRRFRDSIETIEMLGDAMLDNFTNSVNPIAVQTMALLLGDESLQFRFINEAFIPVAHNVTYDRATKVLSVPTGLLQHMTLGIDTISSSHDISDYKIWSLQSFQTPALTEASKKYYLYAKVNKTNESGVFYISETAIAMDGVSGHHHLLMGVLNSEYDGARSYVSLHGFTEVLPGRITTDAIISADGRTYFNLALSEIGGNIKFTSTDGSMKDVSDLEAMIGDGNKFHYEQPIPPYKKGDFWADGKVLLKCIVSRDAGNYVASDWELAVEYDNTKTVIDGGIITSGTVQLAGDDKTIKAGATGEGTSDASVRFWAGATKASKSSAPYRVLQSGKLYASDVEIKGKVTATSGEFNGVVYATDGEFTGKVNAKSGSFEGDVVAKNFKTIGPFQHTIATLTIDGVRGVISNFPYSFMRISPSSNNQQLLISRSWGSKYEGRIIYIHNPHNSYGIQLVNGDYLTGALGTFIIQPRGTIQLMWSQDSNDWIIIDYFQTPTGWRV